MPTFLTVPTTRAATHVLSLWNGTTNDAPPTNWEQPSFDDSAWATSSTPTETTAFNQVPIEPTLQLQTMAEAGVQAVAPWTSAPSNAAAFLARFRFDLPDAPWRWWSPELWAHVRAGGSASDYGRWYLNGQFAESFGLQFFFRVEAFLVPGTNVIAYDSRINGNSGEPVDRWTSNQAWAGWRGIFYTPDPGGSIYAWGTPAAGGSDVGVLGLGDTSVHLTPVLAAPIAGNPEILKVVSNGHASLAMANTGEVYFAGDASSGFSGTGTTDSSAHSTFTRVPPLNGAGDWTNGAVDIGIGGDSAFWLDRAGQLWMWGPDVHGSLGRGNTTQALFPTRTLGSNVNTVVAASVGVDHACALTRAAVRSNAGNNTVQSAGGNANGQIANGTSGANVTAWTIAQFVDPTLGGATSPQFWEVSCGDQQTCLLLHGAIDGLVPSFMPSVAGTGYGAGKALYGSLGDDAYASGTGANKINNKFRVMTGVGGTDIQQAGQITLIANQPFSFLNPSTSEVEYDDIQTVGTVGDGVPYGGAGDSNGTLNYGTGIPLNPTGFVAVPIGTALPPSFSLTFLYLDVFSGYQRIAATTGSQNAWAAGDSKATLAAVGWDGRLYTWGWGGAGQMGSGSDPTTNLEAVSINGLRNVLACAVAEGIIFAITSVARTTRRQRAWAAVIG